MARWWLHNTLMGYRLELEAERRTEIQMYRLQEACAGHGGNNVEAYVRMMEPRMKKFAEEFRQAMPASRLDTA